MPKRYRVRFRFTLEKDGKITAHEKTQTITSKHLNGAARKAMQEFPDWEIIAIYEA